MAEIVFHSSKLKIERAYKHIHDFMRLIHEFAQKTDFYRLSVDVDANTGHNLLNFELTKPIPSEAPLILGDAVHNLHSALDLMYCEIITRAGKIIDSQTKFPFYRKREELEGQIDKGKIKAAGSEICDRILNTVKPYRGPGGNDALYGLHDLDIVDKHHILIIAIMVVGLRDICAEGENGSFIQNATATVEEGGVLNLISTTEKLRIKSYGNPTVRVIFGEGQPFENQSVVPTLHQLAQLVSGTVQTMEEVYLARN